MDKIECYGCQKKIVYPPARVCTQCLLIGHVTERERQALEEEEEFALCYIAECRLPLGHEGGHVCYKASKGYEIPPDVLGPPRRPRRPE